MLNRSPQLSGRLIKLLFLFLFAIPFKADAQKFYRELYGFRLQQYRIAAKNELGTPFKTGRYDDGFEYEAFPLKPDKSVYVVFEYKPDEKDIIWSIQVSGSGNSGDIGFRGLQLGMDKEKITQLLGKPSNITDIGEYGKKWDYNGTNFSVEVNKSGHLSSVKILDSSQELFPKGPDIKKIPSFENVRKILLSGSDADILNLLSGDVEVYYKQKTYSFKKSFKTERATDFSKTLSFIKTISKDLASVDTKSKLYEENMRITLGENVKHVIKIGGEHLVKEIVLKYFGGQYYIYEINAEKN